MKQKQLFIKAACLILLLTTGAARAQNVGIGTNVPQSQLQVVGKTTTDSLRITGGAAAGKLLSSTATGDAEWITPAYITTGRNGLERTGDTLQFGGPLAKNTTLLTNDYRLRLAKPGTVVSGIIVHNMANLQFIGAETLWQSFEMTENCLLDSIRVYFQSVVPSSGCIAHLYEGEGVSGPLLSSTAPFSLPGSNNLTTQTLLFSPLSLQSGKKLTLMLVNTVGWVGNTSNPYPLGNSSHSPTTDFNFTVYGTHTQSLGLDLLPTGEATINGRLALKNKTALELGSLEVKEINAGIIAYQLFSPDALDIVGAGSVQGSRKIKFWAEGGAVFSGPIVGNLQQEAVQAPVLLNGWTNHGGGFANAGYWKDKEGMVHIQGLIKNGNITTSTILFILPAAYRPATRLIFNVNANNVFGRVDVLPSGEVMIATISSNAFLNLEGILFRTN
ncbi:MAG: hypothetical protein JNM19_02975 [Chitinophagaceae bacterium]|nr:hypothetical protein [Chitinophagaceae bacterium]